MMPSTNQLKGYGLYQSKMVMKLITSHSMLKKLL